MLKELNRIEEFLLTNILLSLSLKKITKKKFSKL